MTSTTVADQALYSDNKYQIRRARSNQEFRWPWWQNMIDLGWNRSDADLETFLNKPSGSSMLALIDSTASKDHQVCGHVAALVNANKTGWFSLFVVNEVHRGIGMGGKLFSVAMDEFRKQGIEIVGLDGVAEQRQTYERRGFVSSPFGMVRVMTRPVLEKMPLTVEAAEMSGTFFNIYEIPLHLLAAHELRYTGFERPALWSNEYFFERDDVDGVALVRGGDLPQGVDDVRGWAIVRRCFQGSRVGPLYAESAEVAQAVLQKAMELGGVDFISGTYLANDPTPDNEHEDRDEWIVENGFMSAEIWDGNGEAVGVFQQAGWQSSGVSLHRMWLNGNATPEFSAGGAAHTGVFAIFDASTG
ncbi:hypothetical protein LTR62_005843 [Meristemomyces frigidus]|uniref:N-acetyltransferase domain-containing protein n=1 Tax=Meristemomyces frigidus TaxID=1508187 RepID=A0AAN7TVU2_9PEZI|nr:hypothetical protein LTR62_005843 [Meristemomyces frigidus]